MQLTKQSVACNFATCSCFVCVFFSTLFSILHSFHSALMLQPSWLEEHTPGLRAIVAEPLVVSPGGRHATRAIHAGKFAGSAKC